MLKKGFIPREKPAEMHHGDIYIYLNQIYLHDKKRWYKADIEDIKNIQTILNRKQLLIRFWNYDILLFCKEYSYLLALRDFLNLSQNYFMSRNYIPMDTRSMGGSSVHWLRVNDRAIVRWC